MYRVGPLLAPPTLQGRWSVNLGGNFQRMAEPDGVAAIGRHLRQRPPALYVSAAGWSSESSGFAEPKESGRGCAAASSALAHRLGTAPVVDIEMDRGQSSAFRNRPRCELVDGTVLGGYVFDTSPPRDLSVEVLGQSGCDEAVQRKFQPSADPSESVMATEIPVVEGIA